MIPFIGMVWPQYGTNPVFFRDNPTGCQGNPVTGVRTLGFHAIQVSIRPPSLFIVFNAPVNNLLISHLKSFFLGFFHFFLNFFSTSNNVQGGPGKQSSSRVQVAGVHITAQAGSFKGDGTTAAECISDSWCMAKHSDSQFVNEFLERVG